MHKIQEKILLLMNKENLSGLTLRKIGQKIGEPNSPQKVKHHLAQLAKNGFVMIDRENDLIRRVDNNCLRESNLLTIPIFGSANCGEALSFAQNSIEGHLTISRTLLGSDLVNRIDDLFVLKAVGNSMNRASIENVSIEDGDYVIVDKKYNSPKSGDYVLSVVGGVANIKKFFVDNKNKQLILLSESSQDLPPIYIHKDDITDYIINGKVVKVFKKPDELVALRDASADDILSNVPITKDEYDYYDNL